MSARRARRMSRDIAGVFGARMFFAALGMLSGVVLARWLGPHDRGILALVLLVPATTVTLVKLGISQANVYFINREGVSVEKVASNAAVTAAVLGTLSAAAVWGMRSFLIRHVLVGLPEWALAVGLVRVPVLLLDDYLHGALQAIGRFDVYNRRLIRGEVLRFALVITLIVVLDLGLAAAVVLHTAVTLINVGWLVLASRHLVPFRLRVEPKLLAGQLRFGAKSYLQTTTQHLLLRTDLYMVNAFLGPRYLAYYNIAVRFAELVLEIPQAVGLVLYPRLTRLGEEEMHRVTAQACRRTLLLTALSSLVLWLFGPTLIVLWYGEPYAPAGEPILWVAIGVSMMSVFFVVTRNFTSRNRQQVNLAVALLALAGNVALNLVLIPRMGIVGAALATAISYAGACALLVWLFTAASGLPARAALVPTGDDLRFFRETGRRFAARLGRWWPLPRTGS